MKNKYQQFLIQESIPSSIATAHSSLPPDVGDSVPKRRSFGQNVVKDDQSSVAHSQITPTADTSAGVSPRKRTKSEPWYLDRLNLKDAHAGTTNTARDIYLTHGPPATGSLGPGGYNTRLPELSHKHRFKMYHSTVERESGPAPGTYAVSELSRGTSTSFSASQSARLRPLNTRAQLLEGLRLRTRVSKKNKKGNRSAGKEWALVRNASKVSKLMKIQAFNRNLEKRLENAKRNVAKLEAESEAKKRAILQSHGVDRRLLMRIRRFQHLQRMWLNYIVAYRFSGALFLLSKKSRVSLSDVSRFMRQNRLLSAARQVK
eukprot:822785_1